MSKKPDELARDTFTELGIEQDMVEDLAGSATLKQVLIDYMEARQLFAEHDKGGALHKALAERPAALRLALETLRA